MSEWERLLAESGEVVQSLGGAGGGYPQLQRTPQQLSQLARRLRPPAAGERSGATRLLAQGGVDAPALSRDASSVALSPALDDVFPADAPLADSLESLHESIVTSAVAQVHALSRSSFLSSALSSLERDWQAHASSESRRASLSSPSSSLASPNPPHPLPQPLSAFVDATSSLNSHLERGSLQPSSVPSCFQSALQSSRAAFAFRLLDFMAREVARADDKSFLPSSLALGSVRTLEAQHADLVAQHCRRFPEDARVGADTSDALAQVHGYLRIHRGANLCDFDVGNRGQDTSMQQIYLCLRSGMTRAALKAAEFVRAQSRLEGTTSFAHLIQTWAENRTLTESEHLAIISKECCSSLRRRQYSTDEHSYRAVVLAVLSGHSDLVTRICNEIPDMFTKIEDFLWFRMNTCDAVAGSTGQGDRFRLHELQNFLSQYPADHYSQNGSAPELYLSMLLATLQFHRAMVYAEEVARKGDDKLPYVAPHLAVALIYTNIAASELRGVDAAEGAELQGSVIESVRQPLIEQAKALFAGYPAEALEYVNAIARLDELSDHVPRNDAKIHRFGEALAHLSSSIKTVLGPGESECNGALAKFIAEEGVRHQAVHEAGQNCQRLRNRESAALFFRRAGDYAQALQCITEQLARLGVKQVEERDRVQQAGDTVREIASKDLGEHPERRQHIENYDNLKVATSLIASNRRGRYSEAVEALRGLTFLPQLSARAPELAQSAKQLPWMLSERLADVILAAGESLQQFARSDRSGDAKEHFQALLTFVSHCNIGLPTGLYNKLVAMEPI